MAAGTRSSDEPYRESMEFAWTEKAFGMLQHGELHGNVIATHGIVQSRVWGPCPRCQHQLDDRQVLTAVTNLPGGQWRGRGGTATTQSDTDTVEPKFYDIDVSCGCGDSHPEAPAGMTGCGVSFRVELPIQP